MEAIHAYTGETLVLAGPGSGKTYVLTAHIKTLIEEYQVDPSSILVLTFSKAAALSMRARFFKDTEGRFPPIAFGTFHSVFYQIIRMAGNDHLSLIAPARRMGLMTQLLRQYFPELSADDNIDLLAAVLSRSREQKQPCAMGDMRDLARIQRAVHAYEAYLSENHLIDYDGMILECREILQNRTGLLASIQAQYAFILVDEFQDISSVQYEILRMLYDRGTKEPHALFAVGDDDQSIYGFRGANPSICRDFLRDYPAAGRIFLTMNYRSRPGIVRASQQVIAENHNRIAKTVVSGRSDDIKKATDEDGKAVVTLGFRDKKEQERYLVQLIASMTERQQKETAIIFRTNRQVRLLEQALVRAGVISGEDMAAVQNPWRIRIRRIYDSYMELGGQVRMDRIRRRTYEEIRNVPERFLLQESMPCDVMTKRAFLTVYPAGTPAQSAMAELADMAERLCDLPEALRIRYFRSVIGIEPYLLGRVRGDPDKIRQIREAFAELEKNPARNKRLSGGDTAETGKIGKDSVPRSGAGVRLLTMHACKGLEFDRVYLPDLNEGMIPTRKAHTKDEIEEERRLFYVAMTRARVHLELLYVKGTHENPCYPTRFLLPLGIGPSYE